MKFRTGEVVLIVALSVAAAQAESLYAVIALAVVAWVGLSWSKRLYRCRCKPRKGAPHRSE